MTITIVRIMDNPDEHPHFPFAECVLLAADQRVTVTGGPNETKQKIILLPDMKGALSWFGNSFFGGQDVDVHLTAFIDEARAAGVATLSALARHLCTRMEGLFAQHVPKPWGGKTTGLHIAGYEDGDPVFWFVRNVKDDRVTPLGGFGARQDYPSKRGANMFMNGDPRLVVKVIKRLADVIRPFVLTPGTFFQDNTRTVSEQAQFLRFTMETLVRFYDLFATESIIGGPINIVVITPDGNVRLDPDDSRLPSLAPQ